MERKDIERMLGEILVPVSPSDTFLKRLRARLVVYRGGNPFNPWSIVVVLATMILILVAGLGLFLRVIIGWIGLLGILDQRRKQNSKAEPLSL
ncbi:MAG: hypothetical protein PVH60_11370 [Anaerolineales bacterium]|jgi:hypothetical protein